HAVALHSCLSSHCCRYAQSRAAATVAIVVEHWNCSRDPHYPAAMISRQNLDRVSHSCTHRPQCHGFQTASSMFRFNMTVNSTRCNAHTNSYSPCSSALPLSLCLRLLHLALLLRL